MAAIDVTIIVACVLCVAAGIVAGTALAAWLRYVRERQRAREQARWAAWAERRRRGEGDEL